MNSMIQYTYLQVFYGPLVMLVEDIKFNICWITSLALCNITNQGSYLEPNEHIVMCHFMQTQKVQMPLKNMVMVRYANYYMHVFATNTCRNVFTLLHSQI